MFQNRTKFFYIFLLFAIIVFPVNDCGGGGGGTKQTETNYPNLKPSNLVIPLNANAGDIISVTYSIENDGLETADSFSASFYLSTDNIISSNDTLFDTITIPDGIAPGDSFTDTTNITLPNLSSGTYYIGFIADCYNDIAESDEDDNITDSLLVKTISISGSTSEQANLYIESLTCPSSATSGDAISISYNIGNDGNANAAAFNVEFYISTNNTINTSDTLLYTQPIISLAKTTTTGVQNVNVAVPSGLSTATYYIGCIVDRTNVISESNESDNISTGSTVGSISITAASANLKIESLSCPTSATVGDEISISYNIGNDGNANAAAFNVEFYISTDNTINTSDTLLYTQPVTSLAKATTTGVQNVNVIVPSGLSVATYYIGCIVDRTNVISESNESDNTSTVSSGTVDSISINRNLPNLRPYYLSTPLSTAKNETITITLRVINDGLVSAILFSIKLYLSSDYIINSSDTLLTTVTTTSNLTNDNYVEYVLNNIYIPTTISSGRYFIGFIVDTENDILETDETDNKDTTIDKIIRVALENCAVLEIINTDGSTNPNLVIEAKENSVSWGNTSSYTINDYPGITFTTRYYYNLPCPNTYDFRLHSLGSTSGWDLNDVYIEVGEMISWEILNADMHSY